MATLRPVVDQLGFLGDLGFRRKGGVLLRTDRLLRAVTVSQHQDTGDAVSFFVTFDLGISGISELGGRRARNVVRCAGDHFARAELGFTGSFVLQKGGGNGEVLAIIDDTARAVCGQFLLKYPDEQALFAMVYRGATEFLDKGLASTDEITRLKLEPWNVIGRLKLAGVFAAFLGRKAEAAEVVRFAQDYCTGRNASLDYLLPSFIADIGSAEALAQGRLE